MDNCSAGMVSEVTDGPLSKLQVQLQTATNGSNISKSLKNCNEHDTIYVISSDFGDRMTTQSIGLMVLLSEHL